MNIYKITLETKNLVSRGAVIAASESRAIHVFKIALCGQAPGYCNEIMDGEPDCVCTRQIDRTDEKCVELITRI